MANHGSIHHQETLYLSATSIKLGNAMKNSIKVGMIVILTIMISFCLSIAFAGNESVNTAMPANAANATNATNGTINTTTTITMHQNMTNETKNTTSATINLTNVTMKPKNVTKNTINITKNTTNVTKNATNVTINLTNMTTKPKNITNNTLNVTTDTINITKNTTNEGAKIESEVRQQVKEMQRDTSNMSNGNANEIKSALKNSLY
jgi:hypothetical protein